MSNTRFAVQVLDLGFNLLRVLPEDAFSGISSLTLLALDGNPMASLPEAAFTHLNSSLRGLSLGGRFLTCDCKLRWVAAWIRQLDLQAELQTNLREDFTITEKAVMLKSSRTFV